MSAAATPDGPLLVLDSGLGGLTVLRELRAVMPTRRFVYIADDAAFPYGGWDESVLLDHLVGLLGHLVDLHRPCGVVIACNTASTLALARLRERFPATPFIGTVPAIKPALERTASGVVAVLATPGTVKREYTRQLIARFAAGRTVQLVGSIRLATMAEAHLRGEVPDLDAMRAEIAPSFVAVEGRRTDIVVLACTHYPLLANLFRRVAPWPVDWLDPAEAIARRAADVLPPAPRSLIQGEPDSAEFTSRTVDPATAHIVRGFGLRLGS